MSLADAALSARSAELFVRPEPGEAADQQRCPFPHQGTDVLPHEWLQSGLQCAAGKREFRLNRYFVARFGTGREFAEALAEFREQAAEHLKTGFLAVYAHDQRPRTVAEELKLLGAAVRDAGLTDDADALIAGNTLSHSVDVRCPVTGKNTAYEFFSVAFCKNSGNPKDPLYDPSLSAPFTAINTTSDAFAFARLVHDQSMRAFGRPVRMINDAAMQALGSYSGRTMLFLGLGTGLGNTLVIDGVVVPLELAHLPYTNGKTYEEVVGEAGLKRLGKRKWRRHVSEVVELLAAATNADYTVIGGGNVRFLDELPPKARRGNNANACRGGFRLWDDVAPQIARTR